MWILDYQHSFYYVMYDDRSPSIYDVLSKGIPVPGAITFGQEYVLIDALEPIASGYDYIFIDCPPIRCAHKTNVMATNDGLVLDLFAVVSPCVFFCLCLASVLLF